MSGYDCKAGSIDCYADMAYMHIPILSLPDNVIRLSDFIFTPRDNIYLISQT